MIALFWANLKMMARNRQATFWALFFPLIFVVVFGLFDFDSLGSSRVGVVAEADSPVVSQVIGGLAAIYALDVREEVGPAFQSNVANGRLQVEQGDLTTCWSCRRTPVLQTVEIQAPGNWPQRRPHWSTLRETGAATNW